MIKITIDARLPFDNEIQMFDVCRGIAEKLTEIGQQALDAGDCEQFVGQMFAVHTANDDDDEVGTISIQRTRVKR